MGTGKIMLRIMLKLTCFLSRGGGSSIFSRMKCCPVPMANVFRIKLELLNSL